MADSEFVMHIPCEACGSSDANSLYDDGHQHCFSCGTTVAAKGDIATPAPAGKKASGDLIGGLDYQSLSPRRISQETCKKFGYGVALRGGKWVHVAPYYDEAGNVVAQHLRTEDKDFPWVGNPKAALMFGQQLWKAGGKKVVVTEGEIDAMSLSQAQGNKWPVVSIGCGAASPDTVSKVTKYIAKYSKWLESFEQVIFMFDSDEQGVASAKAAAKVLSPGKAHIATLPLHDANEMLKANRVKELVDAVWQAVPWRPDGLVYIEDLIEEIQKPVEWGIPWCFDTLTNYTYGRRMGELYAFGAGTGIGKTDLLTQQIAYDVEKLGLKVGCIFLEQKPVETGKRIAGKVAHQRFHVPDAGWVKEQLVEAVGALAKKVVLYDNFGVTDWDEVRGHIRHMALSDGIKVFYLDHLTAMADPSRERESLEILMRDMSALANELQVIIHFVSHLATPDGKPHEEGGRVMIRHFKGSRAIGFWSYFMFGMERDQQDEDDEAKHTTTIRVLKDRYTGQSTGCCFNIKYDADSGMLVEVEEEYDGYFTDGGKESVQAGVSSDSAGDKDTPF